MCGSDAVDQIKENARSREQDKLKQNGDTKNHLNNKTEICAKIIVRNVFVSNCN